jgi:phosphate uptake regulator
MFSDFTESVLDLERAVILLGEIVEKEVVNVMMACIEGSDDLCDQIIRFDDEIDRLEESITWMVQEIFSSFSPKGGDLRFLLAVPKVSAHLELIGDSCVDIAKSLKKIEGNRIQMLDTMNLLPQFETVISMMTGSVNSLIDRSAKRAWRSMGVLETAQTIREAHLVMLHQKPCKEWPMSSVLRIAQIVNSLYVMACNAADIAANVVYITHGVDVRYQRHRILEQLAQREKTRKKS